MSIAAIILAKLLSSFMSYYIPWSISPYYFVTFNIRKILTD